ncbi:MAG: TrbC/VirB2 family protein [Patescibacteria group bacterium]
MLSRLRTLGLSLLLTLVLVTPALAASEDVAKVQNFIQNAIQILVTFAGLLAAGFFVMGGIGYITSSGNPEHLDRSKRTIIYSGIGLAVAIGAFVLSNAISELASTAFGG